MDVQFELNGQRVQTTVRPDETLFETLRRLGCSSVKCGCDTTNCGLCTVFVDDLATLSCAYPAPRIHQHCVKTLEFFEQEALAFGAFLADQGADQCGFCNPGMIMCLFALEQDLKLQPGDPLPSAADIRQYLAGNLCRCSGYVGQTRAIQAYLTHKYGLCPSGGRQDESK